MNKIAVFTLTMDRLEYTKHCFKTLRDNAGYNFDHFVVDNGSKDGTVEWLKENEKYFKKLIFNEENVGIGVASNQILDEILKGDYDLIIKMDNDCEIKSAHILQKINEVYEKKEELRPFECEFILSPKVNGINTPVARTDNLWIENYLIGFTGMVGGLFMVTPKNILKDFRYMTDRKRIGFDSQICAYSKGRGAKTGYIEKIEVNHYETTDGQAKRYPEYFEKKFKEQNEETSG